MVTPLFSIGGIASGLDTESIVTQLLAIERTPIVQAQSKQASLRRIDTAWSDIVSKLSAVRSALDNVDKPGDYATHTSVTSSSDAVAVTRTGSPTPGGLSFTVTQLASTYQGALSGTTSLTSADDPVGDGMLQIKHVDDAGYTSIDTTGKTLAQVASAIQSNSALQANASVQRAADGSMRLLISSRRSGEDGGLELDLSGAPASLNTETELFTGQDALLTMGSGPSALQISSPTNRVTSLVSGVAIDLRQVTAEPVTVQVERDTTVTVEKVRELVDAMNTALSTLKARTAYDASTGSAGLLQGEQTAVNLRFDLAGSLAAAVPGLSGPYTSASSVGLEIDRTGAITLDEGKLATALSTDYDGVVSLLTAAGDTGGGEPGPGLFTTLDTVLDRYEGAAGSIADARQGLTDRISSYDDDIERHEVRLETRERLIRAKFAGLESALATLQAQGSTLLSALGFAG